MNFHRPNAPNRGRFADNQVSTRTTPLFRAVQLNDIEVVEALLNKGADPNINTMGYTPFGLAAGNGPNGRGASQTVNFAMMDLLAKHGANVNAGISGTLSFSFHIGYGNQNDGVNSKEGTSALHEAARNGNLDLVKHLIDLGADPNLLDGDKLKPADVIGKARAAAAGVRRTREAEAEAEAPVVPMRLLWQKFARSWNRRLRTPQLPNVRFADRFAQPVPSIPRFERIRFRLALSDPRGATRIFYAGFSCDWLNHRLT